MPHQERVRRKEQRLLRKVKWHLIVLASTYSIEVKLFHSVQMKAMITSHSSPAAEWNELKVWIWPGADIAHLHRNCRLYVGMWTDRLPLTCLTVC